MQRQLSVKGLENTGYMALGMEERWEEEQKASKKRDLETVSEQVFGRCTCYTNAHSLTNIGNIAKQVKVSSFDL